MRALIPLLGGLWLGALGAGMLLPPPQAAPDATVADATAGLVHPGRTLDLLAYRITGRNSSEEPAQALAEATEAPPPVLSRPRQPPPDVGALFRRDVSAVLMGAGGPVLIVVAPDGSTRRVLRVGEPYRDGWTVESIGDQSVVLRRRGDVRQVELHSSYLAAVSAAETQSAQAPLRDPALERLRRKSLPRRQARGDSP